MRSPAALVAAVAIALAVGACSLIPGASKSPHDLALQQLAANQAIWAAKGPASYTMTVERQCFCPSTRYDITVVDGIVTKVTHDGAPVQPAEVQGLPKTVPELFALVAALPGDAGLAVTYDPDFGLPTIIDVDPIANAVDDEYTIQVNGFKPAS